ncbi:MAG TPA: response regulator, partial [bacterium]|nr:response regulator [bacterium]
GHGMPPETIRRVFDPFFSTRFAGRGLGLAAAFGILRRHQGIVEIQSEVGRGTQFTIYLPKRAEPAANNTADEPTVELPRPQLEPPASEAAHPARTILVVDDEESVRNVVRHALTATGYNVLLAGAGVEAIQLFEQHGDRIPVALLDMTMPDMDGAELAHCLLRRDPDLKVVFMTGDAQRADPSLDRPMISKPFALEELLAVLRRQEAPTN